MKGVRESTDHLMFHRKLNANISSESFQGFLSPSDLKFWNLKAVQYSTLEALLQRKFIDNATYPARGSLTIL